MPRPPSDLPDLPERLAATDDAIAELAKALTRARRLTPTARAREAIRLVDAAADTISKWGDAAIAEATRTASWSDVATAIGVNPTLVNKRMRRFRGNYNRGATKRDSDPVATPTEDAS
jgi:hypothetical protein